MGVDREGGGILSPRLRRTIGYWQAGSAATAIVVYLLSALDVIPNGAQWVATVIGYPLFVVGFAFFVFAAWNGIALAGGRADAVPGALAVQAAHAVWFAFLHSLHIQIGSGPWIGVKVSPVVLQFAAGFSSSFMVGTRIAGPEWEVGLNILALVWTVVLFRAWLRQSAEIAPQ